MHHRRLVLILTCLAAAAATTFATAAEPTRVLNGFAFMPSQIIPSPFALSSFTSLTGGGLAYDVKTPFIDVDGTEIGTLEGDVGFMALGFGYQQRFGSWFAARATFVGGARVGVEEQSVLAQGAMGTYVFALGGIARLFQTEKVILSTSLDFSQTAVVGLDAYSFAQQVIAQGLDEDNDFVTTDGMTGAQLGLLAGWAPLRWLGINGYFGLSRGEFTEMDTETEAGGGLAAGADFKNLGSVPIGVQLVARTSAITSASADVASRSWAYGLGVFYTGWEDFSIGVETAMNTFERRGGGDDFESFVATINLKYWP